MESIVRIGRIYCFFEGEKNKLYKYRWAHLSIYNKKAHLYLYKVRQIAKSV